MRDRGDTGNRVDRGDISDTGYRIPVTGVTKVTWVTGVVTACY